jgi:hypothetical protein
MARPRKPTNVLTLTGAFKQNPQRAAARQGEPEPTGAIGDPPDRLTAAERQCWVELVSLSHEGVLCRADRPFLEYGARVCAQVRAAADIDAKMGIRLETVLSKLGMTPADRSRVSALKPVPVNPFAKFKKAD